VTGIVDNAVRRAIALQRLLAGTVRRGRGRAREVEQEVIAITMATPPTQSIGRLQASERSLRGAIRVGLEAMVNEGADELGEMVDIEVAREGRAVGTSRPLTNQGKAAAFAAAHDGRTMREWADAAIRSVQVRTLRAFRQILIGRSPENVAGSLRGKIANYTLAGHDVTMRTVGAGIWAWGREWVWRAHPEIDRVQWLSVLDGRTSDVCLSLHGTVFPVGEGARPPAHPRCRSTVIPLYVGQTPQQTESFDTWIRNQPQEVVTEILGAQRASMLDRLPAMSASSFFREDGTRYTLQEFNDLFPGLG